MLCYLCLLYLLYVIFVIFMLYVINLFMLFYVYVYKHITICSDPHVFTTHFFRHTFDSGWDLAGVCNTCPQWYRQSKVLETFEVVNNVYSNIKN